MSVLLEWRAPRRKRMPPVAGGMRRRVHEDALFVVGRLLLGLGLGRQPRPRRLAFGGGLGFEQRGRLGGGALGGFGRFERGTLGLGDQRAALGEELRLVGRAGDQRA